MRKLIISCWLIAHLTTSLGQQHDLSSATPDLHYIKKSKRQGVVGLVLLLGGLAGVTVGFANAMKGLKAFVDPNSPPPKNEKLAETLGYSGLGMVAASVPFFILSSKNKKKAKAISF
jgi:hypothetical protein